MVVELARTLGYDVLGFIDRAPKHQIGSQSALGLWVVAGEDDYFDSRGRDSRFDGVAVALGIGDNAIRLACLRRVSDTVAPDLVHPSAHVSESAMLGPGSVVFPMAVVNADSVIGSAVIVNSSAVVEHDCRLGDAVHLSPGAILAGGVTVGQGAWIGAGATVLPGKRIGAHAIVGAGAVVTRDVPDSTTVIGVPARSVRSSD